MKRLVAARDFVMGFFDRPYLPLDDMIDDAGVVHFEMRSKAWWAGLGFKHRLREWTEFWSCDQCEAMGKPRRIWQPLLWGHELKHSDAEWAAAGYDKQGTLEGHMKTTLDAWEDKVFSPCSECGHPYHAPRPEGEGCGCYDPEGVCGRQ